MGGRLIGHNEYLENKKQSFQPKFRYTFYIQLCELTRVQPWVVSVFWLEDEISFWGPAFQGRTVGFRECNSFLDAMYHDALYIDGCFLL